jgi:hypothetical protein
LGIGELRAALDAIKSDRLPTVDRSYQDNIESILRLLWCHSREDRYWFADIWQQVWAEAERPALEKERDPNNAPKDSDSRSDQSQLPSSELVQHEQLQSTPHMPPSQRVEALPVQAPPILDEDEGQTQSDFPVNRRSLSYGWRSLRRLRADGVVDVEATIQQSAQQGFYLGPVLQRREVNHARLLLLVDQQGSMVPFHRFSRDLVETARDDSTLEEVQVYYFHNVPRQYVYQDEHLTQPIELAPILRWCDRETSVMIVSDAGAARGNRRLERIRETTKFLAMLRSHTSLVGWLNPVPKHRWPYTAAEILAYLVRMEAMDQDGFSTMIQEVRGVPLAFWSRGKA